MKPHPARLFAVLSVASLLACSTAEKTPLRGADAQVPGPLPDQGTRPPMDDASAPPVDASTPAADANIPPADAGGGLDATTAAPDSGSQSSFSFFITSLEAMRRLSGSQDGFGGDLGGITGADGICQTIAQEVGQGAKTWRAFLSATAGPDGQPVHAIDRIGDGPWYDANGRLVASSKSGLLGDRPDGDPRTIDDLPDEHGMPGTVLGDSHDILTGSNKQGRLNSTDPQSTCNDWTSSSEAVGDRVMCGHSWPRRGPGSGAQRGGNWVSDHPVPGCGAGVNLEFTRPGTGPRTVGQGGGWGGIYCFALTP